MASAKYTPKRKDRPKGTKTAVEKRNSTGRGKSHPVQFLSSSEIMSDLLRTASSRFQRRSHLGQDTGIRRLYPLPRNLKSLMRSWMVYAAGQILKMSPDRQKAPMRIQNSAACGVRLACITLVPWYGTSESVPLDVSPHSYLASVQRNETL